VIICVPQTSGSAARKLGLNAPHPVLARTRIGGILLRQADIGTPPLAFSVCRASTPAGLRVFDLRQIYTHSTRFIVDGGSTLFNKTRRYAVQIRLAAVLADH
jgi:hypothetical protein